MKRQHGQGLVEYTLTLVLIAIVVIAILALLADKEDFDPRYECDFERRIGWEREEEFSHYIHAGDVLVPIYEWERVRELEEKEYAIHCLSRLEK